MQPRNVSSFLLLLTASLTVATAAQLKVFRGTLVHSRVRTEMEVLQDHVIGFDANNSGRIVFVRPATELGSLAQQWRFNQKDVVNLTDSQFLMPGLVDCHFNPLEYFRLGADFANNAEFVVSTFVPGEQMFRNVTYAREVSLDAVRRNLRYGTTTVAYYGSTSVDSNIELVRAVDRAGQRATIHQYSLDTIPGGFEIPGFRQTVEEAVNGSRRFMEYIQELESPLIRASIGPELSATASPELVQALGQIANTTDVLVQIRFAQAAPESATTLPEWEAAGILPVNRTMLVYSVNLRDSEIETYRRRGISIAHGPYGDLNNIGGIVDVRRMFNTGITVGLATGYAVGYSSFILAEMRVALLASRALRLNLTGSLPADYAQLTLAEGFYLATMGGAQALRLGDTVGNFEIGKQFDAIVVDTSVPSPLYTTSMDTARVRIEKFLYLGDDSNIQTVYIAGRLTYSQSIPLKISFTNNSPRIVGRRVTVDVSVNKPVQSLTCTLRGLRGFGRLFSNEQDCTSMTIMYPDLRPGKYVLRVVGNAVTGERVEIRRQFRIGYRIGDCTVNLINRGIVVRGNTVSISFSANGNAAYHMCKLDGRQPRRCESPETYSGLSSGRHSIQVSPRRCTAGSSYMLSATFTVP